jgi:hypothetical protein
MATAGDAVDELATWRQGDQLHGANLVVIGHPRGSVWSRIRDRLVGGPRRSGPVDEPVEALVVVSQSCDIVRSPEYRPFIQVAPLVRLPTDAGSRATRGSIPRFVPLPAAGTDAFVDMDRVMTVEKVVARGWTRTPSALAGRERQALGQAIARYYGRPAFPDDFVDATQKLKDRLVDRHGKRSAEGSAATALREVRVFAKPNWDDAEIEVILYFVVPADEAEGIDGITRLTGSFWEEQVRKWGELCAPTGSIKAVICLPITYAEMDALSYRSSDPLDLDYLSGAATNRG